MAVHKRKVNDVRQWLVEAFQPSKLQKYRVGLLSSVVHYYRLLTSCFPRLTQRLLVLTGPAGSGKTTTLRVLTRELGFEILEWRNPLLLLLLLLVDVQDSVSSPHDRTLDIPCKDEGGAGAVAILIQSYLAFVRAVPVDVASNGL